MRFPTLPKICARGLYALAQRGKKERKMDKKDYILGVEKAELSSVKSNRVIVLEITFQDSVRKES